MKPPLPEPEDWFDVPEAPFELWVTLDYPDGSIELEWIRAETGVPEAAMRVRLTNSDELSWEWMPVQQLAWRSRVHGQSVRGRLEALRKMYPAGDTVLPGMIPVVDAGAKPKPGEYRALALPPGLSPWRWLEQQILDMAQKLRINFSPLATLMDDHADTFGDESYYRRLARKEQQAQQEAAERQARIEAASRRIAAELRRKLAERRARAKRAAAAPPQSQRPPLPPVPVRIEFPALQFQDSLLPLPDLRGFLLRERAAQWWVCERL